MVRCAQHKRHSGVLGMGAQRRNGDGRRGRCLGYAADVTGYKELDRKIWVCRKIYISVKQDKL